MKHLTYQPNLFYYWHTVTTRFRDLDPLHHVNNAIYNSYFEEARIHFIATIPELKNGFVNGQSFVLAKCTVEYLKPILYPSTLLVGTGCLQVGNSSIEVLQAIYNKKNKTLHAVATTKGVWFDLETKRPTKLPYVEDQNAMIIKLDG